ncbi:hypothetical protein PanWU01x14_242300 [Parasponia andersonii]|uniref:Uncharacterized protein n=1 Tax=Parasponia andersonii TaxID=3476 RepID=A0A2P5BG56_PARAD|nr:hypothetical protein PanWU01x14_242300 [Parasponia andersonii]
MRISSHGVLLSPFVQDSSWQESPRTFSNPFFGFIKDLFISHWRLGQIWLMPSRVHGITVALGIEHWVQSIAVLKSWKGYMRANATMLYTGH